MFMPFTYEIIPPVYNAHMHPDKMIMLMNGRQCTVCVCAFFFSAPETHDDVTEQQKYMRRVIYSYYSLSTCMDKWVWSCNWNWCLCLVNETIPFFWSAVVALCAQRRAFHRFVCFPGIRRVILQWDCHIIWHIGIIYEYDSYLYLIANTTAPIINYTFIERFYGLAEWAIASIRDVR